ncbi:MarC family protein [Chryseolinea sp. T2]|uniref:MarC family protein n=1 Tax=Chryseolinea sp. T2 TaxID=3129255 RepID=UPI00307782EE
MPDNIQTFIQLLFIGVIALFPVVNPVGTAFIVMPYFDHLTDSERRSAVKKITLYAFCLCTVTLFAGHWILELFGLTIPVIRTAGGIMICKTGWEFLSDKQDEQKAASDAANASSVPGKIDDKLFYPITFPITTGAGTISVLFTLSAHSTTKDATHYLINSGAILLAVLLMCILIYIFYSNTKLFVRYLGSTGEQIFNRIMAFLIFCVGLQIAASGIMGLFAIKPPGA